MSWLPIVFGIALMGFLALVLLGTIALEKGPGMNTTQRTEAPPTASTQKAPSK